MEVEPNCTMFASWSLSKVEFERGEVPRSRLGSAMCSRLATAVGSVIAGTAADRGSRFGNEGGVVKRRFAV